MRYANTNRSRPFSKDPAVVRFKNRYWLYTSLPPRLDGSAKGWSIGIATSTDLENWVESGEIFPAKLYEENGICAPGAIVLTDGPNNSTRLHLFYQTYGNGPKDAICHAWSDDGRTFIRNPTNPIFHPSGSWTVGRAIDADVIVHNGLLYLFFATRDPTMKVQMLGVASSELGLGFGSGTWIQRCDQPILQPELPWEQDCIEAPAVCAHGERFFMFYGGAYNNSPQQIGCAVSNDLLTWERFSTQPVLPNGPPGSWNVCESGHPFVFTDQHNQTHLFFQGNADMGKTWYISRTTIDWVNGNPVIKIP